MPTRLVPCGDMKQNNKHIRHTISNVMKKRLEADLISIAHRILQLKNKSDINHFETQKLYELAVLKFVEEQYGAIKPTISQAEIEKEVETFMTNRITSDRHCYRNDGTSP
jgi:hypothetical protein